MISITKEEKMYINKNFPEAHIVRTMKQKSKRHRYFCEESRPVMEYLGSVRAYISRKGDADGTYEEK